MDHFCRLSDELLHHILSFVQVEDVVSTNFFSRRWRNFWRSTPALLFVSNEAGPSAEFFYRSLLHHEGLLQKLTIVFLYTKNTNGFHLDSCIELALGKQVKELKLDFTFRSRRLDALEFTGDLYRIPQSLYACSSIKHLHLSYCSLNLADPVQMMALETLHLSYIPVPEGGIRLLTSGCPSLEDVTTECCNMDSDFDIFINNESVEKLEIIDRDGVPFRTTIEAPHLKMLILHMNLRNYSLVGDRLPEQATVVLRVDSSVECDDSLLIKLFADLTHIKDMILHGQLYQVLYEGLENIQNEHIPFLNVTHLELNAELVKYDIPGIMHLLSRCDKLETLIINVKRKAYADYAMFKFDGIDRENYWRKQEDDFLGVLQNLKVIEIHNFTGNKRGDTWVDWKSCMEETFSEIKLWKFLLRCSKKLERMTFCTDVLCNVQVYKEITRALKNSPRASSLDSKTLFAWV